MAPKGGTCFLLLVVVVCATLANPRPDATSGNKELFKVAAKRLMTMCFRKGVAAPDAKLLAAIFKNGGVPMDDVSSEQYDKLQAIFLHVLASVTGDANKEPPRLPPMDASEKMKNRMWIVRNLPAAAKRMKTSSEPSMCYLRAFVAPAAWMIVTGQGENSLDADDYDAVKWAAEPIFQLKKLDLPSKVDGKNMKKTMKLLQDMYGSMSENQRTQVSKWEKEQIAEEYSKCTMKPPSESKSMPMGRCKPSEQWLSSEAMDMMGSYLSAVQPADLDSSSKETMCRLFSSGRFRSNMKKANMKPSLRKKFLGKFKECSKGNNVAEDMENLGPLACFNYDVPDLTPNDTKKALAQLDKCDNRFIKKVKKRLVNSFMSNSPAAQSVLDVLNKSLSLLSPEQLSRIPTDKLREYIKKLGQSVKWTKKQLRTLVKKQLGGKKCKDASPEDLEALKPIAEGLPRCLIKKMKAKDILNNTAGLTRKTKKGKLKAMLEQMKNMSISDLVEKLSGPFLPVLSPERLKEVNITSLSKSDNDVWTQSQAAVLVKKLLVLTFRKLHSLIQGITCKMIDEVADRDVQDMAQGIVENEKWVSKMQAKCAARKIFAKLEKERSNYFKTITEDELDRIDIFFLLHLPPKKVKDLPDSVCPTLLDKLEIANLSKVPFRSPCRPALTQKALRCLTQEKDLSELTFESVSKLGQFLCELPPSKLANIAPDVLNSSLKAMASCQHIPQRYRKEIMALVTKNFGKPSDWSAETVESLCPLLDDDGIAALPNTTEVKDVIVYTLSHLFDPPKALRKKLFDLSTAGTSNAVRRKRAADSITEPTLAVIEDLERDNVFWSPEQLDRMSKDTFLAGLETLEEIPDFSEKQLSVLSKKAVEAFGPVSQMTEDDVLQLGCIIQGFPNSDLEQLPLSLDAVEELARCNWTDSQMESVWKAVAKHEDLKPKQLGASHMVALNCFICGLNSDEINQLNAAAFRDAVGSMENVRCSFKALEKVKPLVLSARGDPSTWEEAEVSELGIFLAGLTGKELASMPPSVLPFLSKTCIPLIPPENIAAFSAAQLSSLGPDNAAMLTVQQRAALTDEQRNALERAETGSDDGSDDGSGEEPNNTTIMAGAPSLSVEGVAAFVKPALVLLMGFLLL